MKAGARVAVAAAVLDAEEVISVQGEGVRPCSGRVVRGELGGGSSVKASEATEVVVEWDSRGDRRNRSF